MSAAMRRTSKWLAPDRVSVTSDSPQLGAWARGTTVVGMLICMAGILPGSALGAGWSIQGTPKPPGSKASSLTAVSCASTKLCFAVGRNGSIGASDPLAEVWNGSDWAIQAMTTLPGALNAVSCTSATACVAVGGSGSASASEPLAEIWRGADWALQQTVSPPGSTQVVLNAVACTSATACSAVGDYNTANRTSAFAEGWNGTAWTIEPSPNREGSGLSGVSCTSATACTAVGSGGQGGGALAERWNGKSWHIQPTPPESGPGLPRQLSSVSCVSTTWCTAVGASFTTMSFAAPLEELWNGKMWAIQPTPAEPFSSFTITALGGVSCASATACMAVGGSSGSVAGGAAGSPEPLTERWDGKRWTFEAGSKPSGASPSSLLGISCVSSTTCTAVGEDYSRGIEKSQSSLVEREGGKPERGVS